jgi:hypothetical protein
MGFFGRMVRKSTNVIKTGAKLASSVSKIPVLGKVLGAVPFVGSALSIAGMASDVMGGFGGGGGNSGAMPPMPMASMQGSYGGGMPALPGSAGSNSIVGNRSIFRNDPNVVEALKPWAISAYNLRQYYRAPMKGYVIRRDQNGDPFAIPKHLAVKYLGYKNHKKPPISVGDWEAVKRADRTVKKVRKVMTTMTRVDKAVGKGGKIKVSGGKRK